MTDPTNYEYQKIIAKIQGLRWSFARPSDLLSIMILSGYAAREFAESLRITLELHPDNEAFQEMARGELKTDNLRFNNYAKVGDHSEFLWHFITEHGVIPQYAGRNVDAGLAYELQVKELAPEVRVMSIVSRERALPGIFEEILKARGWATHPALRAFSYYLRRHIELDSGEGGHAALLSKFKVDDRVLPFWEARLKMYEAVPVLFAA